MGRSLLVFQRAVKSRGLRNAGLLGVLAWLALACPPPSFVKPMDSGYLPMK